MVCGPMQISTEASLLQSAVTKLQLIAANLPPDIGRQLTNVCTVRFRTKELSSMFFELWFVFPGC